VLCQYRGSRGDIAGLVHFGTHLFVFGAVEDVVDQVEFRRGGLNTDLR
jgi:hypothetical protein